ncbi:uncharacterized protein LOC119281248 [Triticum dicoccoides]|uniref:uncharacterized protein LOC119281248 n=1 Tax=Triticum dicoccoides TaxID=85692 RepID=UPI00188E3595|nr:uncharacterized protein LOC119281248 [Triticum dicoccoides]
MSSSIPPPTFSSACLLRSSSMSPSIQIGPSPCTPRVPSSNRLGTAAPTLAPDAAVHSSLLLPLPQPPHPFLGPLATHGSGLGRRSGPARKISKGWCSGKCGRDLPWREARQPEQQEQGGRAGTNAGGVGRGRRLAGRSIKSREVEVVQKNHTYRSPNTMKLYSDIFWNVRDPGSFGEDKKTHVPPTSQVDATR